MREAINDNELEIVAGGAVCLSEKRNQVSFTSLGKGFKLKGVTYSDARAYIISLYANNPGMSEKAFDEFVMNSLINKGWI